MSSESRIPHSEPSQMVRLLDRFNSEKDVAKEPITDMRIISAFAERFDLSYLAYIFHECMNHAQYKEGTHLEKSLPLPNDSKGPLLTETVLFKLQFHLWRATLQQVYTTDFHDNNRKVHKMVVRLPNDGAYYRKASVYNAQPLGAQMWREMEDWHCLPKELGFKVFSTVLEYAAQYLGGTTEELDSRFLYHDKVDRLDIEMRLKNRPGRHFCVKWERGIPEESLAGDPNVNTYIDVWG